MDYILMKNYSLKKKTVLLQIKPVTKEKKKKEQSWINTSEVTQEEKKQKPVQGN